MTPVKTLLVLWSITSIAPLQAADIDALTHEARNISMALGKSLKGHLMGAMKTGGPIKALQVCNTAAPQVTRESSNTSGWEVARTSLKWRNPENAPDQWEQKVMETFASRQASGENIKTMEYAEIVDIDGNSSFRYMKAIATGGPCLACHGAEVSPAVASKLETLYPQDQARGFKAGDIRGAFTLRKKL